jgi:phosphatidyl-myo-inositol dimannoside synthase
MQVLALVTAAFGGRGGIAAATRATLVAFASAPPVTSITVLPREKQDDFDPLPGKIRQRPPHRGRVGYALVAIAVALRSRPHLVYCDHLFMAPLARVVAWLSGAKLFLHIHGVEIWEQPSRARRSALESANCVMCVSRHTRRMVLRYSGASPERAIVVNNTFDVRFQPGDRHRARLRLGFDDDTRVLLSVGRLAASERYKGQDRTIDALAGLLANSKQKVVYLVAGEGDDRSRLETLVRERNLEGVVRFLGHSTESALLDLYQAADLFVMPSTGEGFGIAFIEAMACGTPAIGLSVGGASDALVDGRLGVCVTPENFPAALAEGIERSSRPAELAREVDAHFGPRVFQSRIHSALSATLERFAGGSADRVCLPELPVRT